MVKAYFFDWMETLADYNDENNVRSLLTKQEHDFLMVQKSEEAEISPEKKELIYQKLEEVTHFVYSDSERVIDALRPYYKLAIVSNMYYITAKRIRKLFPDFINKFDVLAFSGEIGLKKPDYEIFYYALNRLNKISKQFILPNEIMMIGNKQDKDIEPALKLGMQAKLIDKKNQDLEEIFF